MIGRPKKRSNPTQRIAPQAGRAAVFLRGGSTKGEADGGTTAVDGRIIRLSVSPVGVAVK
jgi:hypothetical protein